MTVLLRVIRPRCFQQLPTAVPFLQIRCWWRSNFDWMRSLKTLNTAMPGTRLGDSGLNGKAQQDQTTRAAAQLAPQKHGTQGAPNLSTPAAGGALKQ